MFYMARILKIPTGIFFVLSVSLCALVPSVAAAIDAAQLGKVINLAGKQRMLTQKMSKEVMLVALNSNKTKNLESLDATASLFDKTLAGLRYGSAELGLPATNSRRILRQLDKIDAIWANFHPIVKQILRAQTVTDKQVEEIASLNVPLLKQMNKAVRLYEKSSDSSNSSDLAITINLAGKQRMLTQKMSKEFLLFAYGYKRDDNKLYLLETFDLFDRTLAGLLNGDENLGLKPTADTAVREQLGVVSKLWAKFKPIIEHATHYDTLEISRDQVEILEKNNLPLLKEMNAAVGMYTKLATSS